MLIEASKVHEGILVIQAVLKYLSILQLTDHNYVEQTCVFDNRVFDYIVVGGGTAGCVVANRLAENKNTVLLIEAGSHPMFGIDIPFLMSLIRASDASWNYTIADSGLSKESHKESVDDFLLGKVLGGSSSASFLTYSTGSKHDYNDWAKKIKDPKWNWENVLPFFKKSQRLEDLILSETDGEFFGKDGNIGLIVPRGFGTVINPDIYFKVFEEMGNDIVSSLNGNISIGYANAISTISKNLQQNTALTYLSPKQNNPNLVVLKNTIVKKIVFDGNKNAVAVKAIVCNNRKIILRAKKEIIISAGVINTPKLLMMSAIGPEHHLCKHKISVISDLPVGEGLQNHLGVALIFNMTKRVVTERPDNPYYYPATVITGHTALNKSADYPDYQAVNYFNFPKDLMTYCTFAYFFKDSICNNLLMTSVNSEMLFTIINKQKFKSRGRVLLKSTNLLDKPIIYTGYNSENQDIEEHASYIQDYVMKIEESSTYKALGGELKDPKLPQCGEMTKDDLEYWKCYVKYMTLSQHQYSSTCAMGKVVDTRLRVYGVNRLRVVDASVMPDNPAGGTLAATIMIGEKGAAMIMEDA